jgi:hypothetical protein
MTDIAQFILQQVGKKTNSFAPSSRYNGIDTVTIEGSDGEPIVYVRRRFVPPAESFFLLQEHTVTEGERLDNITNRYLGDPERFWQICDANNAIDPGELTETPGTKIKITLPQGIQGNSNA